MDLSIARRATARRSFGLWNVLVAAALAAFAPACTGAEGPQGPAGPNGTDGIDGTDGDDGTDGTDGQDGMNGQDGLDGTLDPSLSPLEKAYIGMGGKDALEGLSSIVLNTAGARWVVGEGYEVEDTGKAGIFTAKVQHDIGANGLRIDYVNNVSVLGLEAQLTYGEIMKDNLGVITGMPSLFGFPGGDMPSDRWASSHKQHMLLNPQLLLRKVVADESIATDAGPAVLDGALHHLLVIEDDVWPITLWVSSKTGKISKLTTLENDHLLRDVELEVFYEGWEPTPQGVRFPSHVVIAREGMILHQEVRDSVDVNGAIPASEYMFPMGSDPQYDDAAAKHGAASSQFNQIFAGIGIPVDGIQTYVAPQQVQPGVWWIQGGSHNTMVVEQSNGLVVADAPLYNERSDAIIAWTQQQFPGKPIKYVVLTHFHDDHTGGLRAFAAEGATVITGRASQEYIHRGLTAKSTVVPDKLAMTGMSAELIAVDPGFMFAISDAQRPVNVHTISSNHAADMLLPFLPNQKIAWVTDLVNAGDPLVLPPPFVPNALQLFGEITNLGLDVQTLITGHGGPAPSSWSDFNAALGLP